MADKKISALTGATTPLAGTEVLPIVQGGSTVKVSVANLTAGRAVNASTVTASGQVSGNYVTSSGNVESTGPNLGHAPSRIIMSWEGGAGAYFQSYGPNASTIGEFSFRQSSSDASITAIGLQIQGGNVLVPVGNVTIGTAGIGIDFSANTHAAGMTSELLSDYEEGTWTPTDGSGAGLGLTVANATYTKIGRLVTANFAITYPATASASTARLGGLPFASSSAGFSFPMAVSTCQTGICKTGLVDTSATTFLLLDTSANALTNVQMSGLFLRGTVIYEV